MFREVPALPTVVPVAAVVLLLLLWHLKREGLLSVPRASVAAALCIYVAGVIANTIFPIYLDTPLRESDWKVYGFPPFADYEVGDALTNVIVFAPVGILVALVFTSKSTRGVLLAAAGFSLAIELSQMVSANLLGGGHVADVNDFIFNIIGAVAGYSLLAVLTRFAALDRLAESFRWR